MTASTVRARVVTALCAALAAVHCAAQTTDPFADRAAAYLVEVRGEAVWAHRADAQVPPASLTKLMTALLVLESGRPLDGIVTVSRRAAAESGARIGLRAGDRATAKDLLAATLIQSANDACLALAEHVGGDRARFVAAMNKRARELDLKSTHFADPCGHDTPGHVSTARDLARLADAAMRQPLVAELATTVETRIGTTQGRFFDLANHNELIGRYPGAIGVKSGYTPKAGKCVIALATRDGVRVLLVLLDAPNRWWDAVAILDRAFALAAERR